jgi:hypothetical protein
VICGGGRPSGRGRRLNLSGILTDIIALNSLLLQETEDVVEDEVAIRLFSEKKGLHEFAPRVAVVGHFADDLNYNPSIRRGLGVDGMDEDFAVLETDRGDLIVDFLEVNRSVVAAPKDYDAREGDTC